MTFLVTALIVLVAGVILALVVRVDPGLVFMSYKGWSVETSLVVFIVALLILFVVFYYVLRALINTGRTPRRLRQWRQKRHHNRASNELTGGLVLLAEGQWEKAEERLMKHIADSDAPVLNYLGAAKAAQKRGGIQRSEDYLKRAYQCTPGSPLAVGLAEAELQISNHQAEQALSTLTHLRYIAPKHPHVLKQLMQLYYMLQDWERLLALLPELHKRKVAVYEELEKVEQTAYIELMAGAARNNDLPTLKQVWHRVPKDLKAQESMVQEYVRDLLICNANAEAEVLIQQVLRKKWSQPLVYLYGLVEGDPAIQLARAESWLPEHREDPTLLLTVGRISIRASLWGKARSYLETSIALDPKPETYKELGDLLDQLGEKGAALECYRQGLSLVVATTAKPAATPPKVIAAEQQRLLSAEQEAVAGNQSQ